MVGREELPRAADTVDLAGYFAVFAVVALSVLDVTSRHITDGE